MSYGGMRKCKINECPNVMGTSKFEAIRAHSAGWFTSRDGKDVYCPEHVPEWVASWREKKANDASD